jgi:hypothetical protein
MGGILTKTTNGLILSEGWESGFESWSKQNDQTSVVTDEAHIGSKELRQHVLTQPPNYVNNTYASKTVDLGSAAVKRVGIWRRSEVPGLGGKTLFTVIIDDIVYDYKQYTAPADYTFSGWLDCSAKSGSKLVLINAYWQGQYPNPDLLGVVFSDDLSIIAGDSETVTNLQAGMKIQVYDSGDVLIGSTTVGGGQTTAAVNVLTKTVMPFQGYIKVYDVDGVTLLYTLPTQPLSGGDAWVWTFDTCYMNGPASSLRIYKHGAVASPKSVSITMTLKTLVEDAPISGKLITFTTSLGTVSPTSDTTDENGEVSTTVTSESVHGWAVVKGNWAGDIVTGAAKCFVEVAIYDEADAGDAAKPYQVFVQGTEYAFASGSYKKSVEFHPQQFTVELKQVESAVDGALEVVIYRRGIKDFVGRILKITRGIADHMILTGLSNHWKLARRIANQTYATSDPKAILADLLVRYPCGIGAGSFDTFGSTILIGFSYDSLMTAIQRLLDITGWRARLNLDDALDFASTLGSAPAVEFVTGAQNVDLTRETDYSRIDTRTILIGDPVTVLSDLDDATQAASYGHVEEAFFDKNLTAQATVDIQNQKILDGRKIPIERISGSVVDLEYAVNAYDVFDSVTVTDAKTGLSGTYEVVSIVRDLKDDGSAEVEFSNIGLDFQDALGGLARTVKDLST